MFIRYTPRLGIIGKIYLDRGGELRKPRRSLMIVKGDLTLDIQKIKADKLIPAIYNPRKNLKKGDAEYKKIERSILEFGYVDPIIVNKDMTIIGGHQRYKVLVDLGYDELDCVVVDLPKDREKALNIALNKVSGEWDEALLIDLLGDLGDLAELTGFDVDEIEDLCGDATKKEDVERLMDGKKADMVFTDPPYGIEVVGGTKPFGTVGGTKPFGTVGGTNKVNVNRYSPIIGDDTVSTAKDFYLLAVGLGVENFVIWGGNYFTEFLPPRKCWIVWDKKGREWDDNFSDFEMAWTSYEKPAKIFTHVWMGMVQGGKREKRVHPTQKPAELVGKIFNYLLTENDMVILDGFGGSGSTLIACEQLNRTCYMMELDPKYCDVIIKRWEELTGQKAELIS